MLFNNTSNVLKCVSNMLKHAINMVICKNKKIKKLNMLKKLYSATYYIFSMLTKTKNMPAAVC